LLAFLVFGGMAVVGVEVWLDRFAWPVDPGWYHLEETEDRFSLHVQHYRYVDHPRETDRTRLIFVGGSTTFGFPERPAGHTALGRPRHGYVGLLAATLEARWPGRFEVVNLGINGGASEDTLRVLRRAIDWDVHGVVVYDGHNEFLSAARPFRASLWRFAAYRRFAMLSGEVKQAPGPEAPPAYGTSKHRRAVEQRFARNLRRIVEVVGDTPLVLSTQASDLSLDPAWDAGGSDALFASGRWVDARDADPYPMRATSRLDALIVEAAAAGGATLVEPVVAPGPATFWDQVHPRGNGTVGLAEAVLGGLVAAGLVPESTPVVARPLTHEERVEATARAARGWLQLARIRHHDPELRLERLDGLLRELEALDASHPELARLRSAASALR